MATPNMLWEHIANVIVVVHNAEPVDQDTWDAYTGYCRGLRKALVGGFADDLSCLIYSQGGAPNGRQRKQHAEAIGHVPVRVALCSSSLAVRAVAKSVTWLTGHRFKVFRLSQVNEGLDYLRVDSAELRRKVHDAVQRMSAEVNAPPMSRQVSSQG